MADEHLIDGHDAAWWKAQREQLKAENDVLNPKLDAANAKLETQALKIADLERQLGEAKSAHIAAVESHRIEKDQLGSALTVRTVEKDQAHEELAKTEAALKAMVTENSDLKVKLAAALALAENRRLAIVPVVKMVGDLHAALTPLIAE